MHYLTTKRTVSRSRINSSTLLLLLAVIGSVPGVVYAASYWSAGSFRNEANAIHERDRIHTRTGLEMLVVHVDDLYRVVVAKEGDPQLQKSLIEDAGITPWSLALEHPEIVQESASESSTGESVAAPQDEYLVLASFIDNASAELLLARLEDDGVDSVAIATAEVDGTTYHRVVQGPFTSRTGVNTDYTQYGITTTWWLHTPKAQVAPAPRVATRSARIARTWTPPDATEEPASPIPAAQPEAMAPEPAPQPEPVYTLSPPRPTESYVDYCVKRANAMERAVFCKDETFQMVSTALQQSKDSDERKLIYCALYASGDERRDRCRD